MINKSKIGAIVAVVAVVGGMVISSASANLTGSTFEGSDGNMLVNTPGNTDWQNAPNLHVGTDLNRSQNDNAFGNGSHEDETNVSVVLGSIPNSKADLGRFADSTEVLPNGDSMLYLAWVRNDTSGTVNFDFELNQKAQPDLTTPGPKVLVRTGDGNGPLPDDLLINYSLQGGSQTPTLNYRKWTGTAWSDPPTAFAPNISEAGFNQTTQITNFLGGPANIAAAEFGEGAINMTAAGLIPNQNDPNAPCQSFASAYVKSRSSASFTSEIKDLVAPVPFGVNNCAHLTIKKVTDPSPDPTNTSFPFNVTGPNTNDSFSLLNGGSHPVVNGAASTDLKAGTYNAAENLPTGWTFNGAVCDNGSPANAIVLAPQANVTCTFTNQARGRIIVHKAISGPADTTTSFHFTDNYGPGQFDITSAQTNDSGPLIPGTYNVAETVPANWKLLSSTCDDGSPVTAISLSPGETINCTFTNQLQVGSLTITKTHLNKQAGGVVPENNVTFVVTGPSGTFNVTTNAQGTVCLDNLFFGNYTVHENVPAGEQVDQNDKVVSVSHVAYCGDGNGENVSFFNTPLTDVHVQVHSQFPGGTRSTIVCDTPANSGPPAGDTSVDSLNLVPGTYHCTVVIDP